MNNDFLHPMDFFIVVKKLATEKSQIRKITTNTKSASKKVDKLIVKGLQIIIGLMYMVIVGTLAVSRNQPFNFNGFNSIKSTNFNNQ